MNAVSASKTMSLPTKATSSRDLREELLGEIFGKGKDRRPKPEALAEPGFEVPPAVYGKGHYVNLYV
ncbi:MAG: hypothetical protein LBR80_05565 [Deltaproteobacteria bacterium]|jgi:hypothetical protein|nr:hypothetical protein [Deltaproteobacteria bacterium]